MSNRKYEKVNFKKLLTGLTSSLLLAQIAMAATPTFTDVTKAAKINHTVKRLPSNFTGGGVAWIDVDNDGLQDLFVPIPDINTSITSYLYRNLGNGTFKKINGFPSSSGSKFGTGVAIGDYDGDGCDDIFVTHGQSKFSLSNGGITQFMEGDEMNHLYRNETCDGNWFEFTDVTVAANLTDAKNSMVSSFGDVDGDGDLDLFVGNYTSENIQLNCQNDHLYLNNGKGRFTNISTASGVNIGVDCNYTLGSTMSDFDNDGDLDIIAITDLSGDVNGGPFPVLDDRIYKNIGLNSQSGLPQFQKIQSTINLVDSTSGMGIAPGDYDNDGDIDYYITKIASQALQSHNRLHQNNGDTGIFSFAEVGTQAGVEDLGLLAVNQVDGNLSPNQIVGWGTNFFDANNDGYLDLYKANGRVSAAGLTNGFLGRQPNRLFMNNHDGTFTEKGAVAGVDGPTDAVNCPWVGAPCYEQSRGTAVADYDNDGDVDIFVNNMGHHSINPIVSSIENYLSPGAPNLFRNESQNNGNPWLQIHLEGTRANHRGIGAKVRATANGIFGSMSQLREIHAGASHGSTDAFVAHFGFPAGAVIGRVTVEWPLLKNQSQPDKTVLRNLSFNNIYKVEKATGEAKPFPTITSFSPKNGASGTRVDIYGASLNDVQSVKIGGREVFWVPQSSTYIWVSTSGRGFDGPVTIQTLAGTTISSAQFLNKPRINSFTPTSGGAGTIITIKGGNLRDLSSVTIGGVPTQSYSAWGGQMIIAAPPGVKTGKIRVVRQNGFATQSLSNFIAQ